MNPSCLSQRFRASGGCSVMVWGYFLCTHCLNTLAYVNIVVGYIYPLMTTCFMSTTMIKLHSRINGALHQKCGIIRKENYIQLLKQNLKTSVRKFGHKLVFQMDNNHHHKALISVVDKPDPITAVLSGGMVQNSSKL
ncbi:hypothetical protein ILYODFUR_028292 [Ilyodon furcidens]|uniref:Transposase n=1 Tax=Ilyodon furcidens TaxID=33524 RepID=A0ABV0TD79_9TELE